MLASVTTFAIDGMESRRVTVEVDIRPGLPAFTIVGLGDRAVREARERVHAAILNSGFEFPQRRVTVNLAPAHMRKAGPGYDLAIACGVLAASGQIPAHTLAGFAVFGELALGGDLRPCRGAIAVAEGAVKAGLGGLVVPPERAAEAALVSGLDIVAAGSLAEAAALIGDDERPTVQTRRPDPLVAGRASVDGPDLGDVRGHASVISALIVAAAGGHNMLMSGPPGVGKTMLARRLPSILPPLSPDEALEVTRVQSVAGLHPSGELVAQRPFRSPHHMISAAPCRCQGRRPSPIAVSCSSTSCPSSRGRRWRRFGSRWRTGAPPSSAASEPSSTRRSSCSSPQRTPAPAGTRALRDAAAPKATCSATGAG